MKKQLEGDFKTMMTNIGASQPDPAWNIEGDMVLSRVDKKGIPRSLGGGGYGLVQSAVFLDIPVAKKVFREANLFDPSEVELL